MRAIEKMKQYSDLLETAEIYVPELDLTVYVKPVTLLQRSNLLQKSEGMDNIRTSVEAIVMLAMDKNGEPLFTIEDKPKLMRLGGADRIISKLFGDIMASQTVDDPLDLSEVTEH